MPVGRPVHVNQNPNPSKQEVEEVQKRYIEELYSYEHAFLSVCFTSSLCIHVGYGIPSRMNMPRIARSECGKIPRQATIANSAVQGDGLDRLSKVRRTRGLRFT